MVSGTQPDSPREWQAEFVGDPSLNRPVAALDGEHFPPARLDGHRLSSANEATRVATYSPVGGDGVETGAGSAAPGLTGALLPESRSGSGQDGSGELRASLIAFILGAPSLSSKPTRTDATAIADAILADGWVRVSVDDDTLNRVAAALAAHDGYDWHPDEGAGAYGKWGNSDVTRSGRYYLDRARAAVQALRGGDND